MVTDNAIKSEISKVLRDLLATRDWSQADLVKAVFGKVTQAGRMKVSRWCSGQMAPSAADLINLVSATGIPLEKFAPKSDMAEPSQDLTRVECIRDTSGMSITNREKWLTISEAAEMLGVSTARVHQLIKIYDIPFEMLNARLKLVQERHIKEFVKMERPTGVKLSCRE